MFHAVKPELLAPAGDWERLEAAVQYGADAVYLGGQQFGMRAAPKNFGSTELHKAVEYCHERGVKVYLTCNTLPRNDEIPEFPAFIRNASEAGVDAVIVADIGLLMEIKRQAPNMEVHISTQAGVVNYLTARELYHLGASRVVLARELSLEDIRTIRENTPPELEIEVFVHGAMCMSFSGRCLLSQYITGRDANRGECAQPCRWGYHLVEEKRPGQYFPIYEDDKGSYILNAQDLCAIEHLDKLKAAGVTSFKLEGRAKSAYYVAVVTNAYRCAMDALEQNPAHYKPASWILEEPLKVSHRQYTTGFLFPEKPPAQYYESGGYVRNWEVVATVDGYEQGYLRCIERNRFAVGDAIEILEPGQQPTALTVTEILDEDGTSLEAARHPLMKVRIPAPRAFTAGSVIRKAQ